LTADDEGDQEFLERHTGFVGGVFTVFPIRDSRTAIQAEALIGQRGARYVDDDFPEEEVLRMTYLEIPLLARFTPRPDRRGSFHVFTGPTFGINLDSRVIEEGESDSFDEYTKRGDVGWTIGGGVDWRRLVLDVRNTHGLTDATKGEARPSSTASSS
jgi:hypothetical protein